METRNTRLWTEQTTRAHFSQASKLLRKIRLRNSCKLPNTYLQFPIIMSIKLTATYFRLLQFHSRPPTKLNFIDHVVGNQPDNEMEDVAKW